LKLYDTFLAFHGVNTSSQAWLHSSSSMRVASTGRTITVRQDSGSDPHHALRHHPNVSTRPVLQGALSKYRLNACFTHTARVGNCSLLLWALKTTVITSIIACGHARSITSGSDCGLHETNRVVCEACEIDAPPPPQMTYAFPNLSQARA
jgi:hypothetical protein